MKILIDNGHGVNTPGKRSVDGKLREGRLARIIARAIVEDMQRRGYDASLLTPEDEDIPLRERVARVNQWCDKLGKRNVCVVSIHHDAMGDGKKWDDANGWSCRCSIGKGASRVSDRSQMLAQCLFEAAGQTCMRKMLRQYPDKPYWVQNLAICRNTKCAAVLTENFFMTNLLDYQFLMTDFGQQRVIDSHVRALIKYVDLCEG